MAEDKGRLHILSEILSNLLDEGNMDDEGEGLRIRDCFQESACFSLLHEALLTKRKGRRPVVDGTDCCEEAASSAVTSRGVIGPVELAGESWAARVWRRACRF